MLDLWIVGIFLLITLVVGVWQGRGITNLSTFSIADRGYSTGILVATITATAVSGTSILGSPEKTFRYGILFIFVLTISLIINNIIIARVIGLRIIKFQGCISVGDMIGKSWGKKAKILTGIAGTLMYITGLGAQVASISYIFKYFLGISQFWGVIIGCGIIITYSAFGGMKAVTITDVIQFIVLIVAIPMICNAGLSKVGGYQKLFESLPLSHLNVIPNDKKDLIVNLEFFLTLLFSLIGPATAQRLLMAQTNKQACAAFQYASLIYCLLFVLIGGIGLSAKVLKPDLDPVLASPYILQLLPIGLKGFAIAGLFAVVMSTADSLLNSAAILLVNDIIVPLSKGHLEENSKLQIARISTVFIGMFSVIATLNFKSIFDITIFSYLFWTPVVVVPFMASVLDLRIEKKSFWFGALGALLTAILWKFFNLEAITYLSSTLPALFTNFIFFFGSHYYYKLFRPEKFQTIPGTISTDESIESKKKSKLSNLESINFKLILLSILEKMTSSFLAMN